MHTHLASRLEKAGLSDKGAAVYAALLALGGAYPSHLAEVTRLNRSTVYKVLLDLSVKGLVSEIQKGKKLYYQVARPSRLLRYTERRVRQAGETHEQAKDILPELERLYSNLPNKLKVQYFEGPEEIMRVYDDHITKQKPYEMVCFASSTEIYNFLPKQFFAKYRKAKERLGIITRGILPDRPLDRAWGDQLYGDVPNNIKPTARYIPHEQFPFQGEITAYGDSKVSIINLKENIVTAVIIEDQSFNRAMRTIFELAWKGAA
ncbi:MAG: helix-turn-helix domain-containing protein [Patescibacteria group bacterium]